MILALKHLIEYVMVLIIGTIARLLPLKIALAVGWMLAALFHFILRFRRREAIRRIKQVYGDTLSDKKIKGIAWVSWRNLCFSAIDMMRYKRLSSKNIGALGVDDDFSFFEQTLNRTKGGFIAATIHMGNWELSAVIMNLLRLPVFSMARKQKNALVDSYINKSRSTFDMEMMFSDDVSLKKVINRIKEGGIFVILPDVRNPRPALTIEFLGGEANLGAGAAAFSYKCECPIVLFVMHRVGWSKHKINHLKTLYPDGSLDKDENRCHMMQEMMATFSEEIERNPEQYFWYNKRWILDPID